MAQSNAIKDREFNKFIGLEDGRSAVLTYNVNPLQINLDGGLNYLGEYDNTTSYVVGDVVTFNGSSYVSLANNTGVDPTNNTWQIIAEKGDQGEQGIAGNDGPSVHSGLTLDDGTNPHGTTKSDVGLANVDNTSDLSKPISTATQDALDLKYDASNPNNYIDASGAPVQLTDIADFETTAELNTRDTDNRNRANHTGTQLASTISDFDTEVSNNTDVAANTAKVSADGSIATHSDVDLTALANNDLLKYNSVSGNFEPVAQSDVGVTDHSALNLDDGTNPHGTTKSDVGLSNVDNTSDANKPISTAVQEALNDKPNIDWMHYIGNSKYQNVTTQIAGGQVLEYLYAVNSSTVYRFISTATTGLYPTEDSFYADFDGTNLSNLLGTR